MIKENVYKLIYFHNEIIKFLNEINISNEYDFKSEILSKVKSSNIWLKELLGQMNLKLEDLDFYKNNYEYYIDSIFYKDDSNFKFTEKLDIVYKFISNLLPTVSELKVDARNLSITNLKIISAINSWSCLTEVKYLLEEIISGFNSISNIEVNVNKNDLIDIAFQNEELPIEKPKNIEPIEIDKKNEIDEVNIEEIVKNKEIISKKNNKK